MKRTALSTFWHRFRADRRGTVAIIVGLSIIGLVGTAGLGIDFYNALAAKSRLDLATDAAAIAAINAAQTYIHDVFRDANRSGFDKRGHSGRPGPGPKGVQIQRGVNRQYLVHPGGDDGADRPNDQRDRYLYCRVEKRIWTDFRGEPNQYEW
jgi:hypothetical protein